MSSIRQIKQIELDGFGVDEENRLYWNSKPVVLEKKLTLSWWVNLSVIVGALSTAVMAGLQVYQLFSGA